MLQDKGLMVGLHISTWTARRYDRKVSDEVTLAKQAEASAGRFNKHLLGGRRAAHQDVLKAATAARAEHYKWTLPWADEGFRLLPMAAFNDYADAIRKEKERFGDAVKLFLAAYPLLAQEAQTRLGAMFNPGEYPSVEQVARKFHIETSFLPVPRLGDFRVELEPEVRSRIENETEERVSRAFTEAVGDAWARLRDVVGKLAERLGDTSAIFRDSLVENITETCSIVGKLNISGDSELERMRTQVEDELTSWAPAALRQNRKVRAETAAKANELLRKLGLAEV